MVANLPDVDHDLNAAFKTAVSCGDIAVVTWLYNIGAMWPDEVEDFTVAQRLAASLQRRGVWMCCNGWMRLIHWMKQSAR